MKVLNMSVRRVLFLAIWIVSCTATLSIGADPTVPNISAALESIILGTVKVGGVSSVSSVTISNTGKSNLVLGALTISGANAAEFDQASDCRIILPGGSCLVDVTFAPALPFGNKSAYLVIPSNDPEKPTISLKLSGQTHAVGTYTISGNITQSGAALPGVTLTLTGTGATATTDSNGDYSFTGVQNGLYNITPLLTDFIFTPVSKSAIVIGVAVSGQDFTGSSGTIKTPTLVAIDITPTQPSIAVGDIQQFIATGTYNDNSTKELTASVTWRSSNMPVASIATSGIATIVTAGSTTITATSGAIVGTTTLTVTGSSYSYVTQWGAMGDGNGQFINPYGVAVDSSGNVYVADTSNNRIQKFNNNGTYITQWRGLESPMGIAVDKSGYVYVADSFNGDTNLIRKFNSNGTPISQWGATGSGNGQFGSAALSLAVDSNGNVYVADSGNYRIQKFSRSGTYITQWGSQGDGSGQFDGLSGIAVDKSGNVYVADSGNYCIQKFSSNGNYITQWGSYGSGNGQFQDTGGITVDNSGNVYVADNINERIQKFNNNGTYITQWGSQGNGSGQFNSPSSIAVDSNGNVYVADPANNNIQEFTPVP